MTNTHHTVKYRIIHFIDSLYKPFSHKMSLQVFRYVVTGLANSGLDIMLFSAFYNFVLRGQDVSLGLVILTPHIAAFWMAFCITFSTGYYISRYILFQETGLSKSAQLFRMLIVNLTSVVLTYLCLKLLIEYLHVYPTVSRIITTTFTSCVSYVTQTYIYFRKAKKPANK